LLSTALKMLQPLRGRWLALAIAALCLLAIAWLRLPLLPTMLTLAPLSILLAWRKWL
ncbi:chromate transporter, partial [Serratia rubidaea]|nr:chromate transporter [Serratia rubidaea]